MLIGTTLLNPLHNNTKVAILWALNDKIDQYIELVRDNPGNEFYENSLSQFKYAYAWMSCSQASREKNVENAKDLPKLKLVTKYYVPGFGAEFVEPKDLEDAARVGENATKTGVEP